MTKLTISNPATLAHAIQFLGNLNLEKPWVVEIGHKTNKRSLNQNALYWRWIDIIGNELGYHKDEMHQLAMTLLLKPKIIKDLRGNDQEYYSTAGLETGAMGDYMDAVSRYFAANHAINLPHPEDQHLEDR